MTGRVIRFPIADPLETALVAATELDREQLEQLRDQRVIEVQGKLSALLDQLATSSALTPTSSGELTS